MKLKIKKSAIIFLSVIATAIAVCLPAAAAGERQNVHIKTPGITVEIPGDAIYTVNEAETGELLTASDAKGTYTITLTGEKSGGDTFNYKNLKQDGIEQAENEIKTEQNADKVTAYETNQAIFFDCINNGDRYLSSTTLVNGYEYVLKLSAGNRELTISDHGIFNTAARSIVFDNIENRPVEVNVLGNVGTIVCVGVVILAVAVIAVILIHKAAVKRRRRQGNSPKAQGEPRGRGIDDNADMAIDKKIAAKHDEQAHSGRGEAPQTPPEEEDRLEVVRSVRQDKPQHGKAKRKDFKSDSAAESFYEEIESDGLFDEQAEEIPTQVQMGYINNVPGDEEFKNTPVRMRVDIIKPVTEDGENSDISDMLELSRNNNEDYDEAPTDDYPESDGGKKKLGRPKRDNANEEKARASAERPKRTRPERTEEERAKAAERRRRRESERAERRESYSDSEYVKSFDSDSYWDKYR